MQKVKIFSGYHYDVEEDINKYLYENDCEIVMVHPLQNFNSDVIAVLVVFQKGENFNERERVYQLNR